MIASSREQTVTQASRGRTSARGSAQAKACGSLVSGSPCGSTRRGFSLIELMIAIVILGLGMVLVATMFPVAWGRARMLAEFTSQKAAVPAADATVSVLARVAGPSFNSASFAGDLIFDSDPVWSPPATPNDVGYIASGSDTRVHALHLENVQVAAPRAFVAEFPYEIERMASPVGFVNPEPGVALTPGSDFLEHSYFDPQVRFHQRLYPPMRVRNADDFSVSDDQWDDILATRRFCWAVFHRLRDYVGPHPDDVNPGGSGSPTLQTVQNAADQITSTRTFDLYYVTLRRPQPTKRYVRQDPQWSPNPYMLTTTPVDPIALPADADVMFPVPWRVQIWIPETEIPEDFAFWTESNIPTQVEVPAPNAPPGAAVLVGMFPAGARFIDEITGRVYRVVNRRIAVAEDRAFLTLDREMTFYDVDLPEQFPANICDCMPDWIIDEERLRTVWVFPPPVRAARGPDDTPIFEGSQPVVGIEIRTRVVSPFD